MVYFGFIVDSVVLWVVVDDGVIVHNFGLDIYMILNRLLWYILQIDGLCILTDCM